jgi:transposase
MRIAWDRVTIYIRTGYTDMRKQINTLAILVRQEFNKDPLDGNLYVFCGTGRRTLKVLYWDKNGFCLWMKRLNGDKFPWPLKETEVREMTREEMNMLLDGIDFFHAHREKKYEIVI